MSEEVVDAELKEPRIEPYYQARAKQLIDTLFDLGLLSESMSRGGIDNVEGLVALYFQQIATNASKCAGFSKRYKVLAGRLKKDDDDERKRHEEEIRWITRARKAETRVAELEILIKADSAKWALEVSAFLRKTLSPPFCFEISEASRLFTDGIEAGIIPEPDCRPGQVQPGPKRSPMMGP